MGDTVEETEDTRVTIKELEGVIQQLKDGRIVMLAYSYVDIDLNGQDYCVCTPDMRIVGLSRLVALMNGLVQNQLKEEGYGRTTH